MFQKYYANCFSDGSVLMCIEHDNYKYTFMSNHTLKLGPFIDRCLALHSKMERGTIPISNNRYEAICGLTIIKLDMIV